MTVELRSRTVSPPVVRHKGRFVPFNRKNFDSLEDKKLDNGGGSGGKPPLGGRGKGGGDRRRYCENLLDRAYSGITKHAMTLKRPILGDLRAFLKLCSDIMSDCIRDIKYNQGALSEANLTSFSKNLHRHAISFNKGMYKDYKNKAKLKLKSVKLEVDKLLKSCKDFMTKAQLDDLIQTDRLINKELNNQKKLEFRSDLTFTNTDNIHNHYSSDPNVPNAVLKQINRLTTPNSDLNEIGTQIGDAAQNAGKAGLIILGGVAAWVLGSDGARSH
jgi:hypothetical protein